MQPFFNNNVADIVQVISLPVEVTGFLLALTEIVSPKTADRIEYAIDYVRIWSKRYLKKSLHLRRHRFSPVAMLDGFEGKYGDRFEKLSASFLLVIGSIVAIGLAALAFLLLFVFVIYPHTSGRLGNIVFIAALVVFALFILVCAAILVYGTCIAVLYTALTLPVFLLYTIVWSISVVLAIGDRLARGSALGAFGLFLALLGLLGEVYQVIVLFNTP